MKPIYPLGLLLVLATSCQKDAPDAGLPPATQVGANTGGCLINGERFVATGYGSGVSRIPGLDGGFYYDSLYYTELNGARNGANESVALFFRSQKIGSYFFNRVTGFYPQVTMSLALNHATYTAYSSDKPRGETYVTNTQQTGQVILTYADVSRGISAGTFEFTAASTFDPSKTVTITSGRFDRKQ